jgi:hypothetical protein
MNGNSFHTDIVYIYVMTELVDTPAYQKYTSVIANWCATWWTRVASRARNNGWSMDNVRPECGDVRSNSYLAVHFDRSLSVKEQTNIHFIMYESNPTAISPPPPGNPRAFDLTLPLYRLNITSESQMSIIDI